jgi:hypothetical protein
MRKNLTIAAAFIVAGALALPAFAQSSGNSSQRSGAAKKQSGQQITCRELSRQQLSGGNMRRDQRAEHEDSLRRKGLCR